jgi:hypothetical protein
LNIEEEMRYKIISTNQEILADEQFMQNHHPNDFVLVVEEVLPFPTPIDSKVTRLAFRNRFTTNEKIALYTAAESNVQLKVYLDDVNAATYIDLTLPETIAGVQLLEAAGIIGSGRANEILTSPISDTEQYKG